MKKARELSFDNTEYAFAHKSDQEVRKSYRIFSMMQFSFLVRLGSFLAPIALKLKIPIRWAILPTIFEQFCGGETLKEVAKTADFLKEYDVECALDYGVEASAGEDNYDQAVKELQTAINYAGSEPGIPMVSLKATGYCRTTLLEKIHLKQDLEEEEKAEWQRAYGRIDAICQTALENKISVLFDAEESWIQGAVNELALQMMEQYNKERPTVYNTYQMYLKNRLEDIKNHWKIGIEKGYITGIKIVRGAYMEKERERAEENDYPSPVQPNKAATDKDYNAAIHWCLDRLDQLSLFIGTHNEKSCMQAAEHLHQHHIPHGHPHVYFCQLYGMSDNITFNLAQRGYQAAKYLPYGPVKDVLPYLIRRSKENSSIAGQMGREITLLRTEIKRRKKNRK